MFSKRLRLKGVRPPSFFIPPGPKFRMGTPRVISPGGVFQLIRYICLSESLSAVQEALELASHKLQATSQRHPCGTSPGWQKSREKEWTHGEPREISISPSQGGPRSPARSPFSQVKYNPNRVKLFVADRACALRFLSSPPIRLHMVSACLVALPALTHNKLRNN